MEVILKYFGKRKGQLKKQQCVDEIMYNLKFILETKSKEEFEEARRVVLNEYVHFWYISKL